MRYSEKEAAEILARVQRNKSVKPKPQQPVNKEESGPVIAPVPAPAKELHSVSFGDEKLCGIDKESGEIRIIIPIAPVTKKNHGKIISYGAKCPHCGRGKYLKLIPSDAYKAYEKTSAPYIEIIHSLTATIDYPVNLKCVFYCKKRVKGDLVGYLQAIQDLLVEGGVLEDDNRNIVASTDGSRVYHDPEYPRTEIVISKAEGYEQWNRKKAPRT